MNLIEAKKWSDHMLSTDEQYRNWAANFNGRCDNGELSTLFETAPGAIVGEPLGYWKVNALDNLMKPWEWKWFP